MTCDTPRSQEAEKDRRLEESEQDLAKANLEIESLRGLTEALSDVQNRADELQMRARWLQGENDSLETQVRRSVVKGDAEIKLDDSSWP
eukprot:scaffold3719_cov247-Pinguiococcus_pyrenoidosus.AAC.7